MFSANPVNKRKNNNMLVSIIILFYIGEANTINALVNIPFQIVFVKPYNLSLMHQ